MGRPVLSKVSPPSVDCDVSGILREHFTQTNSRQRFGRPGPRASLCMPLFPVSSKVGPLQRAEFLTLASGNWLGLVPGNPLESSMYGEWDVDNRTVCPVLPRRPLFDFFWLLTSPRTPIAWFSMLVRSCAEHLMSSSPSFTCSSPCPGSCWSMADRRVLPPRRNCACSCVMSRKPGSGRKGNPSAMS